MNRRRAVAPALLAAMTFVASTLTCARAGCEPGGSPTYADIEAVRYGKTSCFGRCSKYQVLFRPRTAGLDVRSLRKPAIARGTYSTTNGNELARAIDVLEKADFFSHDFDARGGMDGQHYLLAVQRCGETTTIDWMAVDRQNHLDLVTLFNGLDAVTFSVRWHGNAPPLEHDFAPFAHSYDFR